MPALLTSMPTCGCRSRTRAAAASTDVRSDEEIARVFGEVSETFGGQLDVLVHSVAFAAAEDLEGRFTDTPRERFWLALDVSAYSLVSCARAAEPLMEARGGGSILTMTYLGGERAVPQYNVMGVAKAARDGADALGAIDRRLPDDGGDRRGTLAAAPAHRGGRRRRRGDVPPFGRRQERDGDDAVRRLRVSRYGYVT